MRSRPLFFLFLLLMSTTLCSSQSTPVNLQYFTGIVKTSGWSIPVHGEQIGAKDTSFGKERQQVHCILYAVSEHFALPMYFRNEKNDLVLQSFWFNTGSICALEFKGTRFGYWTMAEGEGIGLATTVTWIDTDGDGVFRRIVVGTDKELTIPQWVFKHTDPS